MTSKGEIHKWHREVIDNAFMILSALPKSDRYAIHGAFCQKIEEARASLIERALAKPRARKKGRK